MTRASTTISKALKMCPFTNSGRHNEIAEYILSALREAGWHEVPEDAPDAFINLVETKWPNLSAYDMTRLWQDMIAAAQEDHTA